MEVIPAEPRSTGEDDVDVKTAVGNLRESVTTLLQVLDGSSPFSKLSQESKDKLSTCKLDLESLLDRTSCTSTTKGQGAAVPPLYVSGGEGFPVVTLQAAGLNAGDDWHLESSPHTWKVNRQVMLSSGVGRFLERRRMFEKVTLAVVLIAVLLYFACKRIGTKVNTTYTNDEGELVSAEFVRPSPVLYVAYDLFFLAAVLLTSHRMNRKLLFCAIFSFEGVACAGSQIGAGMIQLWNFHRSLGSSFDPTWKVLVILNQFIRIGLSILIAGTDGVRFGRRVVIAAQSAILAAYLFQVINMRCASKEYPEEFMVCKPSLLTFREMGSAMMLQACVFIAKNIAGKFTGATFGTLHPMYRPSSQAHKETMSETLSGKMNKVRLSMTKSRSDNKPSTSVPEKVAGVQLEKGDDSAPKAATKGDDSAPEAATMPAKPSNDCEEV